MALFKEYKLEEHTEVVKATRLLSALLTATTCTTYNQAFRLLPADMREIIDLSINRKEWSIRCLSPYAQQTLERERVAQEQIREAQKKASIEREKLIKAEQERPQAKNRAEADRRRTETIKAAQLISVLMTQASGMTFAEAYRQLPVDARETISQSRKMMEWSDDYLSPAAQCIVQEERAARQRAVEDDQKLTDSQRRDNRAERNSTSGVIGNPTHRRW